MKNRKPERRAAMSMNESNMKYGLYQMVNNTVYYCQTPYNVALIVEQLSSYNSMLREQIAMEEDEIQQNYR